MPTLDIISKPPHFSAEEELILASFTRRLIEIAAIASAHRAGVSALDTLNTMLLPAISIDRNGLVVGMNAEADAIFDDEVMVSNQRLFIRDVEARAALKASLNRLTDQIEVTIAEPIVVRRSDKLPIILRIWPFKGPAHLPEQDVHALITLNALGPKPGPPAAMLAKAFHLTPAEAKLASIIARGVPPEVAARELKISRETARNRLKSIFAKTDTHRQSELVALLRQVQ